MCSKKTESEIRIFSGFENYISRQIYHYSMVYTLFGILFFIPSVSFLIYFVDQFIKTTADQHFAESFREELQSDTNQTERTTEGTLRL